ncbi:MAG: hypothetical protein Kow0010_18300 [Dehalococcoidia bacterium]
MVNERPREAWVEVPPASTYRPTGGPYDFGFAPAMGRLMAAHPRIGAAFGRLFVEVMFSPEGVLTRREREMVAAVAAAAQDCRY